MFKINFSEGFIRIYSKFEKSLREEIKDKIKLLKDRANHRILKVHKLHGKFKNSYSFSVNYKIRIIFFFLSKKEIVLLDIGDHEVYE